MKILLKVVLKLHSLLYKLASVLAKRLEKQGIHPKHRIMNYHQFFVENISKNDIVLDIGCGNGALTYDLAKKADKVVGVDINEKNIVIAKKKFSRDNVVYFCKDINNFNKEFDFNVIVLSNVLEHIKDRIEFLKNLASQYSKARFLIRVPMINRDWLVLYKKEMDLEWRADKTHYIEYTLESFQEELQKANLKIDKFSIQFGEIWSVVK